MRACRGRVRQAVGGAINTRPATRSGSSTAAWSAAAQMGDGSVGRRADAPFDAILVTAGGPEIPQPLLDQLAPGGRLVGPFGTREEQRLLRVRRTKDGRTQRELIGRCRFVDLVGAHGWAR